MDSTQPTIAMTDWRLILVNLVANLGLNTALAVIKAVNSAPTLDDAVRALESVKTAQQFVDEDAAARGVPPVPLPGAPPPENPA